LTSASATSNDFANLSYSVLAPNHSDGYGQRNDTISTPANAATKSAIGYTYIERNQISPAQLTKRDRLVQANAAQ